MKKKSIVLIILSFFFMVFTAEIASESGKAGYTGSPGETKCNNCHNSFPLNSGGGSVTITSNMANWQYTPGQTYTLNLEVARTGNSLFGMGLEALTSTNDNAGTLVITNSSTQIKTKTVNGIIRNNVVHTLNGGASANSKIFTFNWTAPATNIGTVNLFFTGVAANGNGSENGDYVYSGTQTISPQTTGIETIAEQNSFSVYPVPAKDYLNVDYCLNKSERVSVSLNSLDGKTVEQLLLNVPRNGNCKEHFILSAQTFSKGLYVLTFNAGDQSYLRKVLVQ